MSDNFENDALEMIAAAGRVGIRDWVKRVKKGGCFTHGEEIVMQRYADRMVTVINEAEQEWRE